MRVHGLARSLRRSTTAALIAAALVLTLLPATAGAANILSHGAVSPATGTVATDFTFTVDYVGNQERTVRAHLSGPTGISPIPLTLFSGAPTDGTYRVTTKLPEGTWEVTFRAVPGNASTPGGTVVVTQVPTPTPNPTPVPTATPPPPTSTPHVTPGPTSTARPTVPPTLPPGATPRPPAPTPRPGTPGATPAVVATPGSSATAGASPSEGTLGGNPTPGASSEGNQAPASPTGDPPLDAASDRSTIAAVGRVVMIVIGGAVSISGASFLGVLALRRRARARAKG
jgi:hypothetical protein